MTFHRYSVYSLRRLRSLIPIADCPDPECRGVRFQPNPSAPCRKRETCYLRSSITGKVLLKWAAKYIPECDECGKRYWIYQKKSHPCRMCCDACLQRDPSCTLRSITLGSRPIGRHGSADTYPHFTTCQFLCVECYTQCLANKRMHTLSDQTEREDTPG